MNTPVWIDDKGKIVEPEYCRDFLSRHPMRCINDRFYTMEGPLPDESKLKRTIYEELSPWIHAKVAQTVEQVIKALKLAGHTQILCPCNVTASMWRTARVFWMAPLRRKKSIAATAFWCPIGQMPLRRNTGCASFRNCWNQRIFPPCRSIWVTA